MINDTNNQSDIFVYDRDNATTTRVSKNIDGSESMYGSYMATISGDGRYIAYSTNLLDLANNDYQYEIFLYDSETDTTERVTVGVDAYGADKPNSYWVSLNFNGSYMVFGSDANNLVPDDTNGASDTFVYDTTNKVMTRVSVASDGSQGNRFNAYSPSAASIADDGRYVVFESRLVGLMPVEALGDATSIYLHDRTTGVTSILGEGLNEMINITQCRSLPMASL